MNQRILETIEALGAALPWDTVDIWVSREPEGKIGYTAHVSENEKLGFSWAFGHGETPEQCAQDLLAQVKDSRNPEKAREKKIAELRAKIEKLQAVVIGLPPYKPGRELAERITPKAVTIDVETQAEPATSEAL